jgi:4-hydroxy-2-oxoheptanedioate aldolase
LQHAEAIAAVPGVDVLFLGPGDFSILAGIPYQFDHPLILDAYQRISAAAKGAGKWWGTVAFSPEHAQQLRDQGALLFGHGADILLLQQALDGIKQRFAATGFQFDNRALAEATAPGKAP